MNLKKKKTVKLDFYYMHQRRQNNTVPNKLDAKQT